ncbi:MAG TPA: copper-binding protein [Candidatus Saccharimonadales bacterium]|nr:copper-binding protein [Candidatus Saccharimonadales bacterium]
MEKKMTLRIILAGLALFGALGCSAYDLPPLNSNHPASPQALSAPQPPASKTLAYSRQDTPAVAFATVQPSAHEGHHSAGDAGGQKTAVGEGKVIAMVPSANQIVVEHGEIKDFMEAMTMGYRAEPPSLLEGLKPGDRVRFTIDVPKKSIIKIEKLN